MKRLAAPALALLAACGDGSSAAHRSGGGEGRLGIDVSSAVTTPSGTQPRALCATLTATLYTWYVDSGGVGSWKKYFDTPLHLGKDLPGAPPPGGSGEGGGGSANYVGICYDTGRPDDTRLVVTLDDAWYCDHLSPALELLETLPLTQTAVGTCAASKDLALPVDFEITQVVTSDIGFVDVKATVGVHTLELAGKYTECREEFVDRPDGTSVAAAIAGLALRRQKATEGAKFLSFHFFTDPTGSPITPQGEFFLAEANGADYATSYYVAEAGTQTALRVPVWDWYVDYRNLPMYVAEITSVGTGPLAPGEERCTGDTRFQAALLAVNKPDWDGLPDLSYLAWATRSGTNSTLHLAHSESADLEINHLNPAEKKITAPGVFISGCAKDMTKASFLLTDPADPARADQVVNCAFARANGKWVPTCTVPGPRSQALCEL